MFLRDFIGFRQRSLGSRQALVRLSLAKKKACICFYTGVVYVFICFRQRNLGSRQALARLSLANKKLLYVFTCFYRFSTEELRLATGVFIQVCIGIIGFRQRNLGSRQELARLSLAKKKLSYVFT